MGCNSADGASQMPGSSRLTAAMLPYICLRLLHQLDCCNKTVCGCCAGTSMSYDGYIAPQKVIALMAKHCCGSRVIFLEYYGNPRDPNKFLSGALGLAQEVLKSTYLEVRAAHRQNLKLAWEDAWNHARIKLSVKWLSHRSVGP